jgi:quercetin dioxygenase-like cupin family protein
MPFFRLAELPTEVVTPRHSTATGESITGSKIEVGYLRFKAGTGANPHTHPNEQIFICLEGRLRIRIGDETREIGPGEACLMPPNVEHQASAIEDSVFISAKDLVDGKGHKIE